MLRIGLIDFHLNNWHTDHYPDYLALAAKRSGVDIAVTDAYAMADAPEGKLTNAQWCAEKGIRLRNSAQELISQVDGIMVMGADDCTAHERLAHDALLCGKPVYCDKTFAPTLEAAQRMFQLAQAHDTPLFTCSAQRYVMELQSYAVRHDGQPAVYCATQGPGDLANYSIHQFEMVEYIMGRNTLDCVAIPEDNAVRYVYRYPGDRVAELRQGEGLPFRMTAFDGQCACDIAVTDYYMALMHALCRFFSDGVPPVAMADTLEIMAMQQAAREARQAPYRRVSVPAYGMCAEEEQP